MTGPADLDARPVLARIVRSLTLARIASGMTQKELAERLEVTQSAVESWESGRRIPTSLRLLAWADAVGLRLELLPRLTPEVLDVR